MVWFFAFPHLFYYTAWAKLHVLHMQSAGRSIIRDTQQQSSTMLRRSVPIDNLPDIPGVQRHCPGFPFPKAIEVEGSAVIESPTTGPNLTSCYLVPQWAQLPFKPIEHLTVVGDVWHTGPLGSFRENKCRSFVRITKCDKIRLIYGQGEFPSCNCLSKGGHYY